MATTTTALILCTTSPSSHPRESLLLGLTIEERLLLALQTAGIERVAFFGDGPRPHSDRFEMEIVAAESLTFKNDDSRFLLIPSDTVFDRSLLAGENLPEEGPLQTFPASEYQTVLQAAEHWDARLGSGQAGESGTGFAIRVNDRSTARLAERSLLKSLIKPIDGIISRNLNRHISLWVTRRIVNLGLKPNQVTVAIMLIGLASGVFAALGSPWWALVMAGLCFQGQSVLDGCDGEIARLTYRFSKAGQWLDTVGDDVTNYIFCFGLAIGLYRAGGPSWILAAGVVVLAGQLVTSAILYRRLIALGTGDLLAIPDTVTAGPPRSVFGKVLRILKLMAKRDFFALVVSCIAAIQFPLVAFSLMAIGTFPMLIGVIVNELKLNQADRSAAAEQQ